MLTLTKLPRDELQAASTPPTDYSQSLILYPILSIIAVQAGESQWCFWNGSRQESAVAAQRLIAREFHRVDGRRPAATEHRATACPRWARRLLTAEAECEIYEKRSRRADLPKRELARQLATANQTSSTQPCRRIFLASQSNQSRVALIDSKLPLSRLIPAKAARSLPHTLRSLKLASGATWFVRAGS